MEMLTTVVVVAVVSLVIAGVRFAFGRRWDASVVLQHQDALAVFLDQRDGELITRVELDEFLAAQDRPIADYYRPEACRRAKVLMSEHSRVPRVPNGANCKTKACSSLAG
ncbi:hypothetical protein [Candidatus Poriferisodalis sp.]|uniref:hypothetical protein n=1 Tax=Candidatus Poriferisodalis sp. TaxID=3101277 RepID=UPI003B010241